MTSTVPPSRNRRPLPRWKLALFGAVTVVLFFGLIEGALTLLGVRPVAETEDPYVGFVSSMPLYVEERQPDGSMARVTARNKLAYFNPQKFATPKPHGTYRIFSLGESTTYGNPYDDRTSYSAWLRELLPLADPSHPWEVVNAGGVSYASYRIASLMQELVHYEPDLFIVYVGHNEFLERRTYSGIIDANPSVNRIGAVASRTRTYSVLRGSINAVRTRHATAARKTYQMTGEVDALLDAIGGIAMYARDDTLAGQVTAHYAFNLRRMVRIAHAAGAPIVFVTPASNRKDCAPFKSQPSAGLDAETRRRFDAVAARGQEALAAGDATAAAAAWGEAVRLDPRNATAQYGLGQAQLALRQYEAADASLRLALDEDVCPLRQLSGMRAALQRVAREEHVPLVDFMTMIEDSTEAVLGHRIPGKEFFLDHVHPTVAANRMLGAALLETLAHEGIVHPRAGWQQQAVPEATRIVTARMDPQLQALGLRNVARVFNWAGRTEEAGRLMQQASALVPNDADNFVILGSQAAAEKRSGDAIAYYEQALEANPNQLEARNNLAAELSRAGRYGDALAHYERLLEAHPDQWAVHSNAGFACLKLGRYDRAVEHYADVVDLKPEDATARIHLGMACAKAGSLERAQASYREALRLDPHSAEAHNGLGGVLVQKGQPDSALAEFRRAVELAPQDASMRMSLGSAFLESGRIPEARQELEESVRLDPQLPEAHNLLGLAQWRANDIPAAIASFETELRINPNSPDAPLNRAFVLAAQGHTAEALRSYREAVARYPKDPKLLNGYAWLLATTADARYRDGKLAVAIATRADSLTGHRHPVALNTLAAAYAEVGRYDDAVRVATEAANAARAVGQATAVRQIESLRDRYYSAKRPFHEKAR
jgi:tetratricopeptide (TPR) repeat protein